MADSQTFWLTVTNIALAAVTLAAVLAIAGSTAQEWISRWKARRTAFGDLDVDVRRLFFDASTAGKPIPTEIE